MGFLLYLVIALLVLGVLWWAAQRILAVIPIAEPFKTVIYVVLVVIAVFVIIDLLMGVVGSGGIGLGAHSWSFCR